MARSRKPETKSHDALHERVRFLSRELEIEAALEKVRSRAMSMRSTNMLAETSAVMFKQIQALGIDATRCGVGIFDDAHDAMEVWLTTASAGEKVMRVLDYVNLHVHPVYENILAARKKRKPYAITVLKGEEVKHYYNTMSAYMAGTGRKVVSKEEAYQSFFFDQGTINITTAKPLSDEERSIMVRFAKVFGLIYLRFVDLEKAEAQASEARIEASLERVRSRSLAMRKSKELSDVAVILYKELRTLGVTNFFNCGFVEVDAGNNIQHGWMTRPGGKRIEGFKLPLVGDPVLQERFEAWQRKDPVFYQSVGGDELKEHLNFVRPTIDSQDVDKTVTNKLPDPTVFYAFNFSHGYLHIIADGLLNADEELLATRFAKVFEIAYRRFLDLKLAEAQTREAEIELGLERVRARAMAMQRSDELAELVATVFRELNQLDFALSSCIIWIHHPGNKSNALWIASDKLNKPAKPLEITPFYPPFFESIIAAWKAQDPKWVFSLSGSEKKKFDQLFFKQYPELPEALKKSVRANRQITFSASFNWFGALEVVATEPLTDAKFEILHRFGNVFNSSYTRFNDLQKAEAQAKEAQIELALERVRARTMAMHESTELVQTSAVLFHELKSLGVAAIRTGVAVFDRNKETMELWSSQLFEQKQNPILGVVPVNLHPFFRQLFQAWLRGDSDFTFTLAGDEVKEYYQTTSSTLSYPRQSKYNPREVFNPFFFPEGSLTVVAHGPLNAEERNIMRRFANVFGLLYRRFLDLQKAEAQAREAQIEAALERVRSRSMAMHKSDELAEVITVIAEQLGLLKIRFDNVSFALNDNSNGVFFWISVPGWATPFQVRVPYLENSNLTNLIAARQQGRKFHQDNLTQKENKAWTEHVFAHNKLDLPDKVRTYMLESGFARSVAIMPNIMLVVGNYLGKPYRDETNQVIQRFGLVFEQSYTRFLDLQKAEAQAREAQIEASLERVRSSMMAMHQSDGLPEVMKVIAEQLIHLGVRMEAVTFSPVTTGRDFKIWSANVETPYPRQIEIPYLDHPLFHKTRKALDDKVDSLDVILSKEETHRWWRHFLDRSNAGALVTEQRKEYLLNSNSYSLFFVLRKTSVLSIANFSGFAFSDEEKSILKRFANVFEQTYARFLEILKAEAQSREAQVQLALERVRARTMAMQNSAELAEVSFLLNKQVVELGIPTRGCAFNIYNENDSTEWFSNLEGTLPTYKTPRENIFLKYYEAGRRGETLWVEEFGGARIKEHYQYLFSVNILAIGDEHAHKINESIPDYQVDHVAYFKYGYLLFITLAPAPEAHDVFRRFAKEFEQTYTRFLDLQKAEAQAREAEIQLALERVRARAMAMHHSDELKEVASVMREQFSLLGQPQLETVAIHIYPEEGDTFTSWAAIRPPDNPGKVETFTTEFSKTATQLAREMLSLYKSKSGEYTINAKGDAMAEWLEMLFKAVPSLKQVWGENVPDEQFWHFSDFSAGTFVLIPREEPSRESKDLLKRSASVFDLAYRRYADLKKAEAQAREGQIQLAMERVRARTMAMQKSDELPEAANLLFQQVQGLGMPAWSAGYCIWDDDKEAITLWMSSEGVLQPPFKLPLNEDPSCIRFLTAHQRGESFYVEEIGGEELVRHYKYMRSLPVVSEVLQSIIDAGFPLPTFQIFHCAYFSKGFLLFITYQPVPEAHDIFKRFGQVFDQTYTRFLDLQKAEAQAREAQIEAALEKVRSRSLAMHKSDELHEVIKSVLQRLDELGIVMDAANINTISKDGTTVTAWIAAKDYEYVQSFHATWPLKSKISKDHWEAYQTGTDYFANAYTQEEKNEYLTDLFVNSDFRNIPDERKAFLLSRPAYALCAAGTRNSWIQVVSYSGKTLSPPEADVLKRFARVFEQCHVRFQDLEKAEAQAREAQIEAGLERVRSRSLAMHKSEELAEVVFTLLEQLGGLAIPTDATIIHTYQDDEVEMWIANEMNYSTRFKCPYELNFFPGELVRKNDRTGVFTKYFSFEQKNEAWKQAFDKSELGRIPDQRKKHLLESECFLELVASHPNTGLMLCRYTNHPFNEIESTIVFRFSNVFEQAYTRFLDLQRAEAQAREATIQASLERVRAKAMAMHNSHDLAETIHVFYQELVSMNLTPRRCGIGLMDKQSPVAEISSMNTTEHGISVETIGNLDMQTHPVLIGVYNHWMDKKEYQPILRGQEIKAYYQVLRKQVPMPDYPPDAVHFGYFFFFEEGGVYAWTEKELQEDELNIYRRFTSVLSLTYKRYKDLKDAEARAKEAVKQASLDRVRAEIASMRTADDLQRITPLIWRELRTLGVPFFRCGVLIVNEKNQKADYYLSTPDGHPLAALHLDFSTEIQVVQAALEHWRQQKVFTERWNKEQFVSFARSMMEIGQIQTMKSYQGGDQPPESITLQFTPFAQGMLYVGSAEDLTDDQINLVQALADSFSTAYARYEDFTRLEAAKATVEKTLSELRTTQTQLVQSEKMASLGELTAGIAHEIQNPLNFVNNFSEVSKELLEEMEAELKKGNSEDALQIARDIIQNLEKINLHGKRADGIVKSMLQHSRKSTGQKELTDINALCDEYLRLAYHGLRAKDKSFNAKFETDFDPAVGPISVLPQEIGRVVLNLINNAFYAVTEKKKLNLESYEPTVTITTRKAGNSIEVSVRDNGTGIPQKALDKIFNPFFTTKPTGQGTGLGLSLSYDIVTKGHGGELKVTTEENEGSEFTVILPAR